MDTGLSIRALMDTPLSTLRPHEESNLGLSLRRRPLFPLSYEGKYLISNPATTATLNPRLNLRNHVLISSLVLNSTSSLSVESMSHLTAEQVGFEPTQPVSQPYLFSKQAS